MTAGLNSTRVEICCVFTRGGLESSAKNSTSRFPTTRTIFLKKHPAKYTTSLFNPGWTLYMHFSAFFNPGWDINVRLLLCAYQVESQPGLNSTGVELDRGWTRPGLNSTGVELDRGWTRPGLNSTGVELDRGWTRPGLNSTGIELDRGWTRPGLKLVM